MPNSPAYASLRVAVCAVLRDYGCDLLRQPRRMASLLYDLVDEDDRQAAIILRNLDPELLALVERAALDASEASMRDARDRVTQLLADARSIEVEPASHAADAFVGGVADYLGVHLTPLPQPTESFAGGGPASQRADVAWESRYDDMDRMPQSVYVGGSSSATSQPLPPTVPPQPAYVAQPTPKGTPAWLVVLVAALSCVLVALVVIALTQSGDPSTQTSTATKEVEVVQEADTPDEEATNEVEAEEPEPEPEPEPDPPVFTSTTTNTAIPADGYSDSYGPENVLYDDYMHAWNADYSVGAWIQLNATSPQTVHGLTIINGYSKSEDVYNKNHRPRDITIQLSDGYTQSATLQDLFRQEQTIDFDAAHETTYVRITINSSYSGWKYDDCCIDRIKAF